MEYEHRSEMVQDPKADLSEDRRHQGKGQRGCEQAFWVIGHHVSRRVASTNHTVVVGTPRAAAAFFTLRVAQHYVLGTIRNTAGRRGPAGDARDHGCASHAAAAPLNIRR